MIPRAIKIEVGIAVAAIPAIRPGRSKIVTKITDAIAIVNSLRKLVIAFETAWGVFEMVTILTSEGRDLENLSISLLTSCPK
jgi:hypothetical protein